MKGIIRVLSNKRHGEGERFPAEVTLQFVAKLLQMRIVARDNGTAPPVAEPLDLLFQPPSVDEFQQHKSLLVGNSKHGAQRRLDPARVEAAIDKLRSARRGAENVGEGYTEAAG